MSAMRCCAHCGANLDGRHTLARYCFEHAYVATRRPDQVAAGQAVSKAVKAGSLKPAREMQCVDCGQQARAYDHRDYSRPLDVEPVCVRCNMKRGAAEPYRSVAA